jgi:hypothetical protein
MIRSKIASVACMSLLAVAFAVAPCHAQKKEVPKDKEASSAIVQVDGEYRVIPKDSVAALKEELAQKHKDAVAEHKKAADEAKKNKEKFTTPAPKAAKLKVIKPAIETAAAEKLVAELRAKDDKKAPPKKEAPKKEPPKKTGK